MLRRTACLLSFVLLLGTPLAAQIQTICRYGIKPTENITTFEVNPNTTVIDDTGGISVDAVTFKTYRVINPNFNWGVEVPLARYESPDKSKNGLGDILLAGTAFKQLSQKIGVGAKLEMFMPTATDDLLGTGKFIASPSAFVVWDLPYQFYIAAEYKHYVSYAGDGGRDNVNYMRPRITVGYTSPKEWYALTNLYYYVDFENHMQSEFAPEVELGTLINEGTMFYANVGTHAGGNWKLKDWSVSIGFKLLYL